MNKLASYLMAGYLAFSGLPEYGLKHLVAIDKPAGNIISLSYDIDGDDTEDLREYRFHEPMSGQISEPFSIYWDKNNNDIFEKNEEYRPKGRLNERGL